jgi:2-polyprenyl-6-methoxyphenol hydroxylase-like FAD-dependent oxidoreductase
MAGWNMETYKYQAVTLVSPAHHSSRFPIFPWLQTYAAIGRSVSITRIGSSTRKEFIMKVLIVGASIAGPTAAYWFAKAGAHVTVIERFPNLRTNGQNVDIRTTGVMVMRKMSGMEAAVRSKMSPVKGIKFINSSGRSYATIKPTGNPDEQSLISEYEIFRGDLAQILFDMTKDNKNIQYVFGEQITSMWRKDEDNGPLTVEFANGFPRSQFDLVVACDGATSRTRALGFGCGVRDYMKPINCWAAFFTIKADLLQDKESGHCYSAPGGRFMAIGADPQGGTRAVLMALHPRTHDDVVAPFREAMKQGERAVKEFIAGHYDGAGWRAGEILAGMMDAEDFYANEIVQVKPPSLYRGNFVLVGDAGYAPSLTGTGTTLAMTGAYILAGEMQKHNGNVAAGLRGYEDQMKSIIEEFQKIPPLITTIFAPQTTWGIWIRNNILTFITKSGVLELAQKSFASSFSNSNKYRLPEYNWAL